MQMLHVIAIELVQQSTNNNDDKNKYNSVSYLELVECVPW